MPINAAVEDAVRDSFRAAIAQDGGMMVEALRQFEAAGVEQVLGLLQALLPATLATLNDGRLPSLEQAVALGRRAGSAAAIWTAAPPVDAFEAVVVRASGHEHDFSVEPRDLVMVLILSTADLLGNPPAGGEWNEVLDHVEDLLEAEGERLRKEAPARKAFFRSRR